MADKAPDDRTWSPSGNPTGEEENTPREEATASGETPPAVGGQTTPSAPPMPPQPDPAPAPSKSPAQHDGARILTGIKTFHRDSAVAKGEDEPGPFAFSSLRKKKQKEGETKDLQSTVNETLGVELEKEEDVPQDPNLIPDNALKAHDRVREDRDVSEMAPKPEQKPAQAGGRVFEPMPHAAAPQSILDQAPKKSIVRTYEDDTAGTLKEKKANVAKVMLAEKQKREERDKKEAAMRRKQRRQALMVKAGLSFLGIGGLAFLSVWAFQNGWLRLPQKSAPIVEDTSILEVDNEETIDISGLEGTALRSRIASLVQGVPDGMSYFEFTTTSGMELAAVSGGDFLPRTGANMPPFLERALEGEVSLVSFKSLGAADVALLLPTSSRENAFAGMLSWEQNMARDLEFLFNEEVPQTAPAPTPVESATTTATSTDTETEAPVTATATPAQVDSTLAEPGFSDYLYRNRDVRVYRGFSGNIVFLYTFALPNLLVIADNTEVLSEIIERLERQQ